MIVIPDHVSGDNIRTPQLLLIFGADTSWELTTLIQKEIFDKFFTKKKHILSFSERISDSKCFKIAILV